MDPAAPRRLPPIPQQQPPIAPLQVITPPSQELLTGSVQLNAPPNGEQIQPRLLPVTPIALGLQAQPLSEPPDRPLPQPTPAEIESRRDAINPFRQIRDTSAPFIHNTQPPQRNNRSLSDPLPQYQPREQIALPRDNHPVETKPSRPINGTPLQPVKKRTANLSGTSQFLQFFCNGLTVNTPFKNANGNFLIDGYLKQTGQSGLLHQNTPATILLNSPKAQKRVKEEVNSIHVISNLLPGHANHVAFNRDVYHAPPDAPATTEQNQMMLRTDGSAIRLGEQKAYLQPNAQVSILQRTTMQDKGKEVRPHVVSVTAPAMDDTSIVFKLIGEEEPEPDPITFGQKSKLRPEMETYLDTTQYPPVFNTVNYGIAHDTLGSHILEAAQLCKPKRVVLSAFGVNAFLSALEAVDIRTRNTKEFRDLKDTAQEIAATSLARTIIKLRQAGIEVCFSDVYRSNKQSQGFITQAYWSKVNNALRSLGDNRPLDPVNKINNTESALGDGWAKNSDLIVNAWDPDSLVGNGLLRDNSFDGFLGRMTTVHAVHAAACQWYQLMMLQLNQ